MLSTHTGTHIDCPLHLLSGGFSTSTAAADRFVGQGTVIDCRNLPEPVITESWLRLHEAKIRRAEFVILDTGWSRFWGNEEYYHGFPVPDAAGAQYLAGFALKGVGIDAISFDSIDSIELPTHNALLSKGLVLIENLNRVEALPHDGFIFCCLPMKIENGDGSPVRAVALTGA
jgi:arylformamidase